MSTTARGRIKAKTASTRLNLRVAPPVKDLLRAAARLRKVSLSSFVIRSSQDAAESVLAEQTRFVLPEKKWLAFNAALDAPAKEIPALKRLLTEPSVFDR